jgi:hypothetical protein
MIALKLTIALAFSFLLSVSNTFVQDKESEKEKIIGSVVAYDLSMRYLAFLGDHGSRDSIRTETLIASIDEKQQAKPGASYIKIVYEAKRKEFDLPSDMFDKPEQWQIKKWQMLLKREPGCDPIPTEIMGLNFARSNKGTRWKILSGAVIEEFPLDIKIQYEKLLPCYRLKVGDWKQEK